ncbi:putative O(6)-methylguanine-induced apoptosis 2 [Scophthalmus maximus]|uniref:Putative O(6)-methylguanine-induced apoptosis 2 n=1 Tax=Scophthalmus maximus TaxID=52904 RepID=A0A2U9D3I2_SCOMX|nr:putative O(6)-methylguanine-induced apoptosis 2 [Scophthalmus maximus]
MASDLLTPSATFLALFNRIEGNLYQGLHNFLIVEYEFVVGHYEVNNHLIQHNSKAVLSPFKSKTKRIPALVDDHGPGPGAYSPHQAPRPVKKTILPRGCYLAISEPPLIVPKDPPLPGPGQYDIGNCNGTSKHPMPTAAFASRTERLPRNSQSDMRPGPGFYDPQVLSKQSFFYNDSRVWIPINPLALMELLLSPFRALRGDQRTGWQCFRSVYL